jgi:hypothetical protein
MSGWHFNPDYRGSEAEHLFGDLDAVFALDGELIAKDPLSRVLRVTADGKRYYVKRYAGNGKNAVRRWFGLRALIGPPRVRTEWTNLLAFRDWGIPTATLVGYGLQRQFGSFIRGALITEEIPDTVDLANMANKNDPRLRDHRWVTHVLHQIAGITRTLHNAGFAHNDLKWRNLLVDSGALPTVHLIDCPSGGYWFGPMLRYRIAKDLACLDKIGKYQLSRTQRLRFYLDYAGHKHLTIADKQRIRHILKFFEGRE